MTAARWTGHDAGGVVRRPEASDDKYSRGVVGVRTGSEAYPGAAVLGVEAAWRTGTGMVRYLGPPNARGLVLARRPETVTVDGRVQAWVIGSGMTQDDRDAETERALRAVLAGAVPVVVDAGALDLVRGATAPTLVTPHAREHDRLRADLGLAPVAGDADDDAREAAARETAAALGGAVLLKGAVTIVATPAGWARRVAEGTPWLATAGTGDVLAGAIGAVVAGDVAAAGAGAVEVERLGPLAATGAWLHGRAGARAAASLGPGGGPVTALEVAAALPAAVAEVVGAGGAGGPA